MAAGSSPVPLAPGDFEVSVEPAQENSRQERPAGFSGNGDIIPDEVLVPPSLASVSVQRRLVNRLPGPEAGGRAQLADSRARLLQEASGRSRADAGGGVP